MKLFLQLIQELLIDVRNQGKIPFGMGLHEFPYHNFKGVLRNEAADYQIIVFFSQPLFPVPVGQLLVLISQLAGRQVCAVGDEGGLRISSADAFAVVLLVDVFFNVDGIADDQVAVFHHHLFGDFPIFPDGFAPFGAHPFVAVGV